MGSGQIAVEDMGTAPPVTVDGGTTPMGSTRKGKRSGIEKRFDLKRGRQEEKLTEGGVGC